MKTADQLLLAGYTYYVAFLFYITFLAMAVLKLVTGIFVQQSREVNIIDRDCALQDVLEKKSMVEKELEDLFDNFDDDDSGYLEIDEFRNHINDGRIMHYFASLDIDATDADKLF